jgi:hypothetical protein
MTASRTTGVAPLAVFFDATGTTDAATTSAPFHDLQYGWSFGDPAGGATWRSTDGSGTGKSRNLAAGPVAAHVFETPGTYTVTLAVLNGTTQVTRTVNITVTDPETVFSGTNTRCFSNTADFTGCPSGATQITTSDFAAAINGNQGTGRRLLFKRGNTFSAATSAVINASGPGIVGAFGTGAAPLIDSRVSEGNALGLSGGGAAYASFNDWRIMDLHINGNSVTGTAVNMLGGGDKLLFLRLEVHHSRTALGADPELLDYLPGHHMYDSFAVVDSNFHHSVPVPAGTVGAYGAYIGARQLIWLGNIINDSTGGAGAVGSHLLRLPYVDRGVISNSVLRDPYFNRLALKLHGPCWGNNGTADVCIYREVMGRTYSEKIVISDNEFNGSDNQTYLVDMGPQNGNSDERIRQILFERNWYSGGSRSATSIDLRISATDITIRNNVFTNSDTHSDDHRVIALVREGVEPTPNNIRVYNNSSYSANPADYALVYVDPQATNVTVRNNLVYAPNAANGRVVNNLGSTSVTATNNSTDAQVRGTAPGWSTQPPTLPSHMRLNTGSYAKNAGASVPVFMDFFVVTRPLGVIDMGATKAP